MLNVALMSSIIRHITSFLSMESKMSVFTFSKTVLWKGFLNALIESLPFDQYNAQAAYRLVSL